jgi:tRNA threonylcarbamoyladenosine biosynthesis protein TsaB
VRILAVDTATAACSVALWQDGECLEEHAVAPRDHTRLVLSQLDAVLAAGAVRIAELDAIAFGHGPGSFTGVRIAAGLVQGLAAGSGVGVIGISDLRAMAEGARRECGWMHVAVALDARMGEVYFGLYAARPGQAMAAIAPDRLAPPGALALPGEGRFCGAGAGWTAHAEALAPLRARLAALDPERLPRAGDVAALAAADLAAGVEPVPAEAAAPNYLRNEVARRPGS